MDLVELVPWDRGGCFARACSYADGLFVGGILLGASATALGGRIAESMSVISLRELSRQVGESLLHRDWTVGIGESCTGGLVSKLLTDVPGSSQYLKGGVVAYANDAKIQLLSVDEASITAHGAVSEKVAAEMAVGAAGAFGADVGLAITGISGPTGASPGRPLGTVWFALSIPGEVIREVARFPGDREAVRESAAGYALRLLLQVASKGETDK